MRPLRNTSAGIGLSPLKVITRSEALGTVLATAGRGARERDPTQVYGHCTGRNSHPAGPVPALAEHQGQPGDGDRLYFRINPVVCRVAARAAICLVEQCTSEAGELARYSLVTGQSRHQW